MISIELSEPPAEGAIKVRHVVATALTATNEDYEDLVSSLSATDGKPPGADDALPFIDGLMRALARAGVPHEGHVIQIQWSERGSVLIWRGDPERWLKYND